MKNYPGISGIGFMVLLFASCTQPVSFNASDWHTDGGNLYRQYSVNQTSSLPLGIRWQKDLGGVIQQSEGKLSCCSQGVVYQWEGTGGHGVSCFDYNNGNKLWTIPNTRLFGSAFSYQLNKGEPERIAFGCWNKLQSNILTPGQPLAWTYNPTAPDYLISPVFINGALYFTQASYTSTPSVVFKALSAATGGIIWQHPTASIINPVIGFQNVFLSTGDSHHPIEALNALNGNVSWQFNSDVLFPEGVSPVVNYVLDMNVPAGSNAQLITELHSVNGGNNTLVSLNPVTGSLNWSYTTNMNGDTNFALSHHDGSMQNYLIVTVGADAGPANPYKICSIDKSNGHILWSKNYTSSEAGGNPVIWGDYVFNVENNHTLRAYRLTNGNDEWHYDFQNQAILSQPIIGDKTLYVVDGLGFTSSTQNRSILYAFSPLQYIGH